MTIKEILRAVADEHGVSIDDLKGQRRIAKISSARRDAIHRLRASKYSIPRIAMSLKKSRSSIDHHVYPATRERKSRYHRERYEARI